MPINSPYRGPISITNVERTQRKLRSPQHSFHIEHIPYIIQPFMIAPVLPGETMKNALIQTRAVSDPVKNPLIGWWLEYYIFYVKLTDLAGRDDFKDMMLDLTKDMSSYHAPAFLAYFHGDADKINFSKLCLERVTEEYFRDEGEGWDDTDKKISSMPLCQISGNNYIDSLIDDTVIDKGTIEPVGDEKPMDVDLRFQTWEHLRAVQLTNMSFEDYLASHGVKGAALEVHRPELIRFIRDWRYPSNTIDPTDGSPTSALSWSVAERADKDRFFTEPGFIFGCTIARPKVYMKNLKSSGVTMMDNAMAWLPAMMSDDPHTSLRKYSSGDGPILNSTNDYWIDVRDLLIYGDQYVNFDTSAAGVGMVDLPLATLQKRYIDQGDIDGLFVDAAGGNNKIRQDGVCSFKILGTQIDYT